MLIALLIALGSYCGGYDPKENQTAENGIPASSIDQIAIPIPVVHSITPMNLYA